MSNRLIRETSPYLLQHAENPVDWYPWGEEAQHRARVEDKPILLSIGYSACHWCHVMAHESFENPNIARIMNEHFVNVKVDREERPDLDEIYMAAVQAISGGGGWPMTVFLTPEGAPFYGGTYFPPEDRHGSPGFSRVLIAVADTYRNRRPDVEQNSRQLAEHLSEQIDLRARARQPEVSTLDQAFDGLANLFDPANGGLRGAPKFPQPTAFEFVLRTYHRTGDPRALSILERTLTMMARGGIYDQLGGGFHRYAVDERWLVPHFEKMLYDNALLSLLYLHGFQATGKQFYREICEQTLDYILREMTDPAGGFYSSQDADSEGVEGKFYVWRPDEIVAALGPEEGELFCRYYDVTTRGNREGHSILHIPRDATAVADEAGVAVNRLRAVVESGRGRLYAARERRVRLGRDDKVLTAWNGLALRSFAEAAGALGRDDYRAAAVRNAEFLLTHMRHADRLLRSYRAGTAAVNGYLEDYACLADGLLALYEATFDLRWFEGAHRLVGTMIGEFWDDERGGFFDTGRSHEPLIARPKTVTESAIPSGNSVAADVLLRLAILADEPEYAEKATVILGGLREPMIHYPNAFGRLLGALDFHLSSPKEIAIVGDPATPATRELLAAVFGRYLPNKVVSLRRPDDQAPAERIRMLADRGALDDQPTVYVCEHFTCGQPTTDPADLARQLEGW